MVCLERRQPPCQFSLILFLQSDCCVYLNCIIGTRSAYKCFLFLLFVFDLLSSTSFSLGLQGDYRAVCQTVGLWFVQWPKGKFGGWDASVLSSVQECKSVVWELYRKIALACAEPSLFMPVAERAVEQRETDTQLDRGQSLMPSTSCDPFKGCRRRSVDKEEDLHYLTFVLFSPPGLSSNSFCHSSPVAEAENVAQVCPFIPSFYDTSERSYLCLLKHAEVRLYNLITALNPGSIFKQL